LNELLSKDNQKVVIGAVQNLGDSATKIGTMAQRMQTIVDAQFGPQRTDIPALVKDTRGTMAALQNTAGELNKTAQEFSKTAQETTRAVSATSSAFNSLSAKVTEKGGVLDQVSSGSAAFSATAQSLNASTLPRVARAADDTAKTARALNNVANSLSDNPQSLIYGAGSTVPGPGEPGFVAPTIGAAPK
jgi:phospholipid/cholesterol/gamma-HCH transport system substrate-binding protein